MSAVNDVIETLEGENARLRAALAAGDRTLVEINGKQDLARSLRSLATAKAYIQSRARELGLISATRKPDQVIDTVAAAVRRDIEEIRKHAPELAASGLAASALRTARSMDDPNVSPTALAGCARALLDTMDRLRELAPPERRKDRLDELSARRAARLTSR